MKNKKRFAAMLLFTACVTTISGCGKVVESAVVAEKSGDAAEKTMEIFETDPGKAFDSVPGQVGAPAFYQGAPVEVPDVAEITTKKAELTLLERGDTHIAKLSRILSEKADKETLQEKEADSPDIIWPYTEGNLEMDGIPYTFFKFAGNIKDRYKDTAANSPFHSSGFQLAVDFLRLKPEEDGYRDSWTQEKITLKDLENIDKAREAADNLVQELGFDEFQLGSHYELSYDFTEENTIETNIAAFHYERVVDGVPITWVDETLYPIYEEAVNKGNVIDQKLWKSENLSIEGTNEHIWFLRYDNPLKITPDSGQPLTLLPFEEIRQIYENTINDKYKDTKTFTLNKVKLGYMRTRENANATQSTLIPVWDFFGTTNEIPSQSYSLLTIDACTGTIIERKLGF